MKRYKQLIELYTRFTKDFDASLANLTNEEQLIITGASQKIVLLFQEQKENHLVSVHEIFEKEILRTLRDKAKAFHQLRLMEYFDSEASRLVEVLAELGVKIEYSTGEQELNDEEYKNFLHNAFMYIEHKHERLLLTKPERVRKKAKENNELDEELSGEPEMQAKGDREELMDIEACAKFLDCSKVTIHEYKNQGMPHYQVGRTVKFKKDEVLNFMRQQNKKKKK